MDVGTHPKTMQHFFFDNKSIRTASDSSIVPGLFASELSTEIQFKTLDSIRLRTSQANPKIRKSSYFRCCSTECIRVYMCSVCVCSIFCVYTSELLLLIYIRIDPLSLRSPHFIISIHCTAMCSTKHSLSMLGHAEHKPLM